MKSDNEDIYNLQNIFYSNNSVFLLIIFNLSECFIGFNDKKWFQW